VEGRQKTGRVDCADLRVGFKGRGALRQTDGEIAGGFSAVDVGFEVGKKTARDSRRNFASTLVVSTTAKRKRAAFQLPWPFNAEEVGLTMAARSTRSSSQEMS